MKGRFLLFFKFQNSDGRFAKEKRLRRDFGGAVQDRGRRPRA
jgi:hypothetical protein